MVSFDYVENGMLITGSFPDKHAGENLIETEKEAWELAHKFAAKTRGKYINICVIDSLFKPVDGYKEKEIVNR